MLTVAEGKRARGLWASLGAGLVTGASDDDPSGIATYAQAGAGFGYGLAWTLLLTYQSDLRSSSRQRQRFLAPSPMFCSSTR
jgi:hypothetical protein